MTEADLVAAAAADLDGLLDVVECWAGTMTAGEEAPFEAGADVPGAAAARDLRTVLDRPGTAEAEPPGEGVAPPVRSRPPSPTDEDVRSPIVPAEPTWRLRLAGLRRSPGAAAGSPGTAGESVHGTAMMAVDGPAAGPAAIPRAPGVRPAPEPRAAERGPLGRLAVPAAGPSWSEGPPPSSHAAVAGAAASSVPVRRPPSPLLRWDPGSPLRGQRVDHPDDRAAALRARAPVRPYGWEESPPVGPAPRDELVEQLADVLESALLESGIDLS